MSETKVEGNQHLDPVTGEYVSKNELKKRQKQRDKESDKASKLAKLDELAQLSNLPKPSAEQSFQQTSVAYYESRIAEINELKKNNVYSDVYPYPYKIHITRSIKSFRDEFSPLIIENNKSLDKNIESISGRVLSFRKSGQSLAFLVIEEEGFQIQVYCNKDECELILSQKQNYTTQLKPNLNTLTMENIKKSTNYGALTGTASDYFKQLDSIKRGDIIAVTGIPMRTKTGELSIRPASINLLAPCLRMLPKQNQSISDIEYRYNNRSVDLFMNKKSQTIVKRIKFIQYIKNFFINKYEFLEVETPILHQVKGGANAKPFITFYNDLGQDVFLRIAPELYLKQLVIGGINRVFEMNRNFRNESIDNTHLPEFTMVESYCAYWDLYDQMEFVEDLLSSLAKYANITFNGESDNVSNPNLYLIKYRDYNGKDYNIDFRPPFVRHDIMSSLTDIISKKIGEQVKIPKPYGSDECNKYLQTLVFDKLHKQHKILSSSDLPTAPFTTSRLIDFLVGEFLEKLTHNPMFLLHHPTIMSPLAKPHRDDPEITERFEVFCGMFELCNAYTELNDSQIQKENFESQLKDKTAGDDEACDVDDKFIKAMEHGMVCQSGLGIGIDRLMMLMCGEASIRECIAFPLLRQQK
ncbi:Lysyl-tRNA synthetase [Spironucleus salmonicida]|uniref:lysine--tRNA ligase n=1 Tax=Spironucleus salmonicida TaxID=348837 RepID=V6LKV0_9EUKA|nr:Lysyl-tRNA synthetase [Spironucleus salmonicida]|eukprot:EST44993.1 Lysyl-tRNA synthetase [Spironucleus salmonicida]